MLATSISYLLGPALGWAPLVVLACSCSLHPAPLSGLLIEPPFALARLLPCALSPPSRWAPSGVLFHVYGARLPCWAPQGVSQNVYGARFHAGHWVCFSHVCGARLSRWAPFLFFVRLMIVAPGHLRVHLPSRLLSPPLCWASLVVLAFLFSLYSLHSSAL